MTETLDALERLEAWKGSDENRGYKVEHQDGALRGMGVLLALSGGSQWCRVRASANGMLMIDYSGNAANDRRSRWHTCDKPATPSATIHAALNAAEAESNVTVAKSDAQ